MLVPRNDASVRDVGRSEDPTETSTQGLRAIGSDKLPCMRRIARSGEAQQRSIALRGDLDLLAREHAGEWVCGAR